MIMVTSFVYTFKFCMIVLGLHIKLLTLKMPIYIFIYPAVNKYNPRIIVVYY